MNNVFILNPAADPADIMDAICDRLVKAKSITASILNYATPNAECPQELMLGVLEALDAYLAEIEYLYENLFLK